MARGAEGNTKIGRERKQEVCRFEIKGATGRGVTKLTIPRGSAVFFTGMTIHGSFANQPPDRPRRAWTLF